MQGCRMPFVVFEKADVEPDIIDRPSLALIENLERNRLSKSLTSNLMSMALDSSITEVMIRLKQVRILNIHEPIFDKTGEIYLVTSVADGSEEKPLSIKIETFSGIKRGDTLDIAEEGVSIYQSPSGKLPRYLDIRLQIVESDKELRDAAEIEKAISEQQGFKDIQKLLTTLATAANPMLSTFIDLAGGVIPLIGKLLEMNKDDQICYYAATFTDKFDNLGVGLHSHTKPNEVEFSYEILSG
jgi:hypothetical protein